MCDPTVIAGIGAATGALSAGLGYVGQRQQAKQQAASQAQSVAAEQQRALQEQSSIRMRQAQEKEATARELQQVNVKSMEALARARVAAGDTGVSGASVTALMDDYTRQQAGYRGALLRQQELSGVATGLGLEQAGLASQQRLIGINQPINKPSALGAILQGTSQAMSGYSAGLTIGDRMNPPKTTVS